MTRHQLLLFLVSSCLITSSCLMIRTDPDFDPEFQALEALVEPNPAPSAILGMWHRSQNPHGDVKERSSLLFQSNGTGLATHHLNYGGKIHDTQEHFRWSYQGGGRWQAISEDNSTSTLQLANGKLLRTCAPWVEHNVFTRVN